MFTITHTVHKCTYSIMNFRRFHVKLIKRTAVKAILGDLTIWLKMDILSIILRQLCHGDKWLIFIFSFCFVPPLTTSIMPHFMIYAYTQKFANWQIFISCGHPNLTVCCWGSWPPICQIMYRYNIHPSKLHINFWIVHSLFLTEYIMLSGTLQLKVLYKKQQKC